MVVLLSVRDGRSHRPPNLDLPLETQVEDACLLLRGADYCHPIHHEHHQALLSLGETFLGRSRDLGMGLLDSVWQS